MRASIRRPVAVTPIALLRGRANPRAPAWRKTSSNFSRSMVSQHGEATGMRLSTTSIFRSAARSHRSWRPCRPSRRAPPSMRTQPLTGAAGKAAARVQHAPGEGATAMKVKRIVHNIAATHIEPARIFYQDVLGLDLLMDHGWIATYGSHEPAPL